MKSAVRLFQLFNSTCAAVTLTALCALNCAADSGTATSSPETVSFQKDVLPGLIDNCSVCHRAEDPHGYLVIDRKTTYQAIVNVNSYQLPSMKRVEPGKPEQSYLWLKSINTHHEAGGYGWNMPVMTGLYGPLKDRLYQWILEGAKNN